MGIVGAVEIDRGSNDNQVAPSAPGVRLEDRLLVEVEDTVVVVIVTVAVEVTVTAAVEATVTVVIVEEMAIQRTDLVVIVMSPAAVDIEVLLRLEQAVAATARRSEAQQDLAHGPTEVQAEEQKQVARVPTAPGNSILRRELRQSLRGASAEMILTILIELNLKLSIFVSK